MEITNEERREVAGRIRERICRNHRAAWDVVLELSYIDVFGDRFRMNKEFTLFLADLIDRPTCKKEEHDEYYWRCTRCGGFICWDAVTDCCGVIPTRYCPNCGAEVVE